MLRGIFWQCFVENLNEQLVRASLGMVEYSGPLVVSGDAARALVVPCSGVVKPRVGA